MSATLATIQMYFEYDDMLLRSIWSMSTDRPYPGLKSEDAVPDNFVLSCGVFGWLSGQSQSDKNSALLELCLPVISEFVSEIENDQFSKSYMLIIQDGFVLLPGAHEGSCYLLETGEEIPRSALTPPVFISGLSLIGFFTDYQNKTLLSESQPTPQTSPNPVLVS